MNTKSKHGCRRIIALLLTVITVMAMFPTAAFAAQPSSYRDPAEHWMDAGSRTNELDVNAVVSHETFYCPVCGQHTSFTIWRTPEYTRDGQTALTRNVLYSDGTMVGGKGTGTILDGDPGVDAFYTGYHWTKSMCDTCGTMNANGGISGYSFSKNVYNLYDCAAGFSEDLDDVVTYEYADDTYHTKTVDGGHYCEFCFGTVHTHTSTLERHNLKTEIKSELDKQRFAIVTSCADCGYSKTEYVAAKSVVADYYGAVDGKAHTLTVSDLSESGVATTIRYGNTASGCTLVTPPSYTEEGQYTVYYAVTYAYKGVSMTENGVAYVWLRDESVKVPENPTPGDHTPTIPADSTEHNYVYLDTVAPTCTTLGYDRYLCSICGAVDKRNYTNAVGHAYQTIVIRDADCEHEGKTLDICRNCGDVKENVTPKGEHQYKTYKIEATCTAPGYTVKECSICGDRQITDITAVKGHSFVATVVAPTCTTGGHTQHICKDCGECYFDNYTQATGHNWDDGEVIANPSCTGDGVMEYTCVTCGAKNSETIPATGHTHGNAANCTDPEICTVCGAVLEKAHGHDYVATVTAPTCTKMGWTTYTCKSCGQSYRSDYTDATGHDYKAVVTAPTCTQKGYTTYTCANCGNSYIADYTDALGHDLDNGTVIADATCAGEGVIEYNCTRCPYHELHAISAKGHKPGPAATCTEPQICLECGAILENAIGHDYEIVVTAPTCTELGYTTYTCKNGGETIKTDYVLPTGHSYIGVVTEPTCEEGGYITYTCENCGDSYVSDYTDALDHEFGEGKLILDSACTHDGVMEYTCVRCPYHELHAISAKGHNPGPEATCTEPQLCKDCGAVIAEAKGHSYETVVTAPTCTEMGYTTFTCADCGDSYKADYTDPTGHKESGWIVDKEPTLESEGHRYKKCETCGEKLADEQIEKLYNAATTDSQGEAVVGGYLVIVTDTDTKNPIANASVVLNEDYSISIRLPNRKILDYADQTTVTVLLTKDKSAVKDMQIRVTDKNGNYAAEKTNDNGQITVPGTSGVTGEDGKITFGWLDADGNPYTFTILVQDYENGRPIPDAVVTIGKTGNIKIVLPGGIDIDPDNRITITVTDNQNNPLPELNITVQGDKDTEIGETDNDGVLVVPEIIRREEHGAYIYGYPDGTFGPARNMTRSEAAAIFARLLAEKKGDTIVPVANTKYDDIPANAWYSGYVKYLSSYGITYGTGDNKFSPNNEITRGEFVTMAVRFFEAYGDGNPTIMVQYKEFTDVSSGYWAAEYIREAALYGWIKGYGDGTFRATQNITRAEVVTIVNRLLDRTADEAYIAKNLRTLNTFSDMNENHWAYYAVMEAANAHNATYDTEEAWSK